MDSGDRTYQQLYGSGGAVDRLTALYGLRGLGAEEAVVTAGAFPAMMAFTAEDIAAGTGPGSTRQASSASTSSSDCGCMTQALGLSAEQASQLQTVCAQDPEAFKRALRAAGHDPAALCKPWYKKPKGMVAIGGGVLAAGLLAWAVL